MHPSAEAEQRQAPSALDAAVSLQPRLFVQDASQGGQVIVTTPMLQLAPGSTLQPGQVLHLAPNGSLAMPQVMHVPAPGQLLQLTAPSNPFVIQPQHTAGSTQPSLVMPQQFMQGQPIILGPGQSMDQIVALLSNQQMMPIMQLQAPTTLNLSATTLPDMMMQQQQQQLSAGLTLSGMGMGNMNLQQLPTTITLPQGVIPLDLQHNTLPIQTLPSIQTVQAQQQLMLPSPVNHEATSRSGAQADTASPMARQQTSSLTHQPQDAASPMARHAAAGALQWQPTMTSHRLKRRGSASPDRAPAQLALPSTTAIGNPTHSGGSLPLAARPSGRSASRSVAAPAAQRKRTRPSHHLAEAEQRLATLSEQLAQLQAEHGTVLPKALVLQLAVKCRATEIAHMRLLSEALPNAGSGLAASQDGAQPGASTANPAALVLATMKGAATAGPSKDGSGPAAEEVVITGEHLRAFDARCAAALSLFNTLSDAQTADEDRLRAVIGRLTMMPSAARQAPRYTPMDVRKDDPDTEAEQLSDVRRETNSNSGVVVEGEREQSVPGAGPSDARGQCQEEKDGAQPKGEPAGRNLGVALGSGMSGQSANTVIGLGAGGVSDVVAASGGSVRPPSTLTFNDAAAGVPLSALLHSPLNKPATSQAPAAKTPASLSTLATALPLLFLCNPSIPCLMGKLLISAGPDGDAGVMASASHWQRVLALMNVTPMQMRMLRELYHHVQSMAQRQEPLCSNWAGCLTRLHRLESNKKAQSHLVSLGGPFLKNAELQESTFSLVGANMSVLALVADMVLAGIFSSEQVMVLLTSSWPFFPDLLSIVEVAAQDPASGPSLMAPVPGGPVHN